jgi:hypothetical protein
MRTSFIKLDDGRDEHDAAGHELDVDDLDGLAVEVGLDGGVDQRGAAESSPVPDGGHVVGPSDQLSQGHASFTFMVTSTSLGSPMAMKTSLGISMAERSYAAN